MCYWASVRNAVRFVLSFIGGLGLLTWLAYGLSSHWKSTEAAAPRESLTPWTTLTGGSARVSLVPVRNELP